MKKLVTKNEIVWSGMAWQFNVKRRVFPAGLEVERATNQPGEKYWLKPFKGMPAQWREYGYILEPYEIEEIAE